MKRVVLCGVLCALVLQGSPAWAYESASTHAGMTQRAGQHKHRLHFWLKQVHGLALGAYEPLRLVPETLPPGTRETLNRHLADLDPVHGYRPDAKGFARAAGWLAAGTVLEGMPFSRSRNHFLNPTTGRGLRNATGRGALALRMRTLDFMEGRGNFGGIFTGANFNLTGKSVLTWARHEFNHLSLKAHFEHRLAALVERSPLNRRSRLAMALVTAGALLHLLQEMAVPAHVRNDFVTTYLARRSNITLDRASAYETLVLRTYGRTGIPKVAGTVPSFRRFDEFFRNKAGTGLANQTRRRFYSLGSLPKARRLRGKDTAASILTAVNKSLPVPAPRVGPLTLRQAIGQGLYYGTSDNPYLFAYRITPAGRLEFTLDKKCYQSSAKRLVPEAVRYSAGLFAYLLRGQLHLKFQSGQLQVTHTGPALAKGTLHILWESASGQRIRIRKLPVAGTKAGAAIGSLPLSAVPKQARRIVVAFSGVDALGEPLVLGALGSRP